MRKDKQGAGIGLPEIGVSLDELVRRGARQVIEQVIDNSSLENRRYWMRFLTGTRLSHKQLVWLGRLGYCGSTT